jgi:hypothetical protein
MAYNYLSLTNDVLRRLNEVELTSSNFATATGQYAHIKDAVNFAIRDINQDAYEWPFNYHLQTDTLVAGTLRYSFPSDFKTCSMDTFRIKRDATFNNETRLLKPRMYEEYLEKFVDQEYDTSNTGIRTIPQFVFKSPNLEYLVAPAPDNAYELVYEYYKIPDDLEAYDDVPTIPFQFRKVINNGALYYAYMFRADYENVDRTYNKFTNDVKQMRSLYVNRFDYAKSTMIERGSSYARNTRVT